MSPRARKRWAGKLYRRVGLDEYTDEASRSLTDFEFRIRVLVRQGQQSARSGLFRVSIAALAEELDRTLDETRTAFLRVVDSCNWHYDHASRWLFIPEAVEVSWDGSPAQLDGYINELERQSPPSHLLQIFFEHTELLRGRFTGGDAHHPDTSTSARGDLPPDLQGNHAGTSPTPPGERTLHSSLSTLHKHENSVSSEKEFAEIGNLIPIAQRALEHANVSDSIDHLVDMFRQVNNTSHRPRKTQIVAALRHALPAQERPA